MKPTIVVDIGNSRVKWGRCANERVVEMASLDPDHSASWEEQVKRWNLTNPSLWAVAGVHLQRRDRFVEWLTQRGDQLSLVQDKKRLPLKVELYERERVGIDRLLNAVAARNRVRREVAIFIVDAGSAVTVDWVDEEGAFRGGAIFPGIQLMAKALHDYTAALPLVEIDTKPPPRKIPELLGTDTRSAIKGGVYWAVAGGIKAAIRQLLCRAPGPRHRRAIFLTGGDAQFLASVMDSQVQLWPEMTLEGIRLAAEALP